MPLSVFDHHTLTLYREIAGASDPFGHTFGGEAEAFGLRFLNCEPLHLLYRLNQADPSINVTLQVVSWLPLCLHFWYASHEAKVVYRVLSNMEIELIAPDEWVFDPNYPYPKYPRAFPDSPVAFRKQKY